MDEIKNDIQKRRLRWFGHVMRMKGQRIPKRMLRTKMEGRHRTKWINQIRKYIEMSGKIGKKYRKTEVGE